MTLKVFTSGSGTWTVPSGVSSVKVTLIGAGGGGGGSAKAGTSGNVQEGGGGGGGACTQFTLSGLTSGTSYSYSVGAGGAGGAGTTTQVLYYGYQGKTGSAGGATSFGSYYVNGGSGGGGGAIVSSSRANGTGGAGGSGGSSLGTIYDGGAGGKGGSSGSGYGAGGSVTDAGGGGGGLGDVTIYNYAANTGYGPYTYSSANSTAAEGGKVGHYGTGGGGDSGFDGSLYGVGGTGGDGLIILEYTQQTVYTNLAVNITNGTGTYDGSTKSSITMLVPIGGTYSKSGTSLYIYYNGSTYATITNIVASSSAYDKEVWSSTSGTFASGGTTITVTFSEATYTGTIFLGTNYSQYRIRQPSAYAGSYTGLGILTYTKGTYIDIDWDGATVDTTVDSYEKYTTVYNGTNIEHVSYSDAEDYSGDGKTLRGRGCTIKPYPNTATESSKTYYYRTVITFNANNGSGAPSQVTSDWSTSSTSIYASWSGTPTRSGYTFKGWATSSTATTAEYSTYGYFAKGAITLYAVWEQTPNNWYSVLGYNANNGSGAPSNDSSYISQVAQPSARTVTVTYTTPTRDGYKFLGWSTSSTATSATYAAGSTLSVVYQKDNSNPSITLYAVWEKVPYYYSILYYNANGGSGAPSTDSVKTESNTTPSARAVTISSTTPTKTGHTFLGWSTSSTATTATYQSGDRIYVNYTSSSTTGTTLYAVWKVNTYTITIGVNPTEGGSITGSQSGTYDYGSTVALQAVPSDNWLFTGWNDSYPQAFRSFTVTADGEYIASFRRKVYTIRLYANDGTTSKTDQSMQCGVPTPLISNPYKRSTYSFMGWATSAEGEVAYTNEESVSLSTTDGEIVSLYAVWDHVEPSDPGVIQFKRWDGSTNERLTYSDIVRIEDAVNTLLGCVQLDGATYHSTPTRATALDYRDMSIIEAKTSAMAAMMDVTITTFTSWYAGYRLTYADMERIESNLYAVYISFGGTTPRIDA